jgi:hypothetical protein
MIQWFHGEIALSDIRDAGRFLELCELGCGGRKWAIFANFVQCESVPASLSARSTIRFVILLSLMTFALSCEPQPARGQRSLEDI